MKMKNILLALSVVPAMALSSCDVEKEEEGKLPEVEVDVDTKKGKLPEYDVDTADVEVKKKKVEVTVPDVDVTMPDEKDETDEKE